MMRTLSCLLFILTLCGCSSVDKNIRKELEQQEMAAMHELMSAHLRGDIVRENAMRKHILDVRKKLAELED